MVQLMCLNLPEEWVEPLNRARLNTIAAPSGH